MSAERLAGALVWAVLAVGLLLRIAAGRGDLWLDEVWSLQLAGSARSPLDVLLALHHDNNNYLNTLWLMALSANAPPLACRLLAIAAGAGTVWLAAAAARQRGEVEAGCAAFLPPPSPLLGEDRSQAPGHPPALPFPLPALPPPPPYL